MDLEDVLVWGDDNFDVKVWVNAASHSTQRFSDIFDEQVGTCVADGNERSSGSTWNTRSLCGGSLRRRGCSVRTEAEVGQISVIYCAANLQQVQQVEFFEYLCADRHRRQCKR